jgi:glutathione S-transferase
MQLIGMLDSPYVRRTAISLRLLNITFEHRAISVFRTFEQFRDINPVVKAPTLICDDGTVLMDSTLIIDHAESVAGRSLMPTDRGERLHALRVVGLGLAACEKAIQIVYERTLRPPEKQHEPWATRVQTQLVAAVAALDGEQENNRLICDQRAINQAGITTAVAWRFIQMMLPNLVAASDYPMLAAHSAEAEGLPVFKAAPPQEP